MAVKGNWKSDYTAWKQGLKQQYEFAQKSIERYGNMLKDSLVPSKPMMKYLPNIKEHRSVYRCSSWIRRSKKRRPDRATNNGSWPKERAIGALQEAETADQSAISFPGHEYRNDYLKPGELALAGYTLFKGYITSSIYFRFTIRKTNWIK
jgi:HlyD family secretion protein